jgi:peptide/nickel transport system ATP-binding protein/oligopeptide transport system ATP-binding protein
MSTPVIQLEGLSKSFKPRARLTFARRAGDIKAVDEVSFAVGAGETLALVGESGCGKSTTGRLILRLIEPTAGRILFEGKDIATASARAMHEVRRHLQIIFQDPFGSMSPRRTIAQIIAEPLDAQGMIKSAQHRRDTVAHLLERVGLSPEHMHRYPRQFSGGQRQRIGIARAIGVNPRFIVADEPVSALDVSVQAQIVNLMQDLQEEQGLSYLFISHDLAIVRHIADRVAVMYLGRIVEEGPKAQIFAAPQHPYTHALLSAAPEPNLAKRNRRIILQGDVPSPSAVPSGCSFRTRCPLAQEICAAERPALRSVAPGQLAACHFATPNPIAVPASVPEPQPACT